jgi:copper oxidase (laccase) domain-containing protein
LPACNRLQLLEAGLQNEQIHTLPVCTYEQHTDYFSARRLGINSGRIFTGIMLKEE